MTPDFERQSNSGSNSLACEVNELVQATGMIGFSKSSASNLFNDEHEKRKPWADDNLLALERTLENNKVRIASLRYAVHKCKKGQ